LGPLSLPELPLSTPTYRPIPALPERNLDLLRALAVLAVLGFHFLLSQGVSGAAWLGRIGVLAFFVHTSVVLLSSLERSGQGQGWLSAFYIRRVFRIYPLSIAMILVVLIVGIPWAIPIAGQVDAYARPSWWAIASNLLLVQNLTGKDDVAGVLWTLPLEVQMYAVLPLCLLAARRGVKTVLVLLLAGVAGGLLWQAMIVKGLWRVSVLPFVPCFMAGVLVHALRIHRPSWRRAPGWLWPVALVVLGAVSWQPDAAHPSLWAQWTFCLALGLALFSIRDLGPSWITAVSKQIATYSYGCYLLHSIAIWYAFFVLRNSPAVTQWSVCAAGVLLLPWIAHHLVERPGIRIGQHLVRRRELRPAVVGIAEAAASEIEDREPAVP
jgi:peptidoglycan/LPS O-acetylase OafA/YrhL